MAQKTKPSQQATRVGLDAEDQKLAAKFQALQEDSLGLQQYLHLHPECEKCVSGAFECVRWLDEAACVTCRRRSVRCPAPADFAGWVFTRDDEDRAAMAADYLRLAPRYAYKHPENEDPPRHVPTPSPPPVNRRALARELVRCPPGVYQLRAENLEKQLAETKAEVRVLQGALDEARAAQKHARSAKAKLAQMQLESAVVGGGRDKERGAQEADEHYPSEEDEEYPSALREMKQEASDNWAKMTTACASILVPLGAELRAMGPSASNAVAMVDALSRVASSHLVAQAVSRGTFHFSSEFEPTVTRSLWRPQDALRIQKRKRADVEEEDGMDS